MCCSYSTFFLNKRLFFLLHLAKTNRHLLFTVRFFYFEKICFSFFIFLKTKSVRIWQSKKYQHTFFVVIKKIKRLFFLLRIVESLAVLFSIDIRLLCKL
mgnify:CR=1